MKTTTLCAAALVVFLPHSAVAQEWRGLVVAPEERCAPYDDSEYHYSQSVESRIADSLGGVYSPCTCETFRALNETDIEHVVARSGRMIRPVCGLAGAQTAVCRHWRTIGVLPSSRQAPSVIFELGQAWALGKRILLISLSKADWLSFALKRVLVLRVDVKNRQALDFALEQFLSAPADQQPEQIRKQFERKALGPQADALLERLKQWRQTEGGRWKALLATP